MRPQILLSILASMPLAASMLPGVEVVTGFGTVELAGELSAPRSAPGEGEAREEVPPPTAAAVPTRRDVDWELFDLAHSLQARGHEEASAPEATTGASERAAHGVAWTPGVPALEGAPWTCDVVSTGMLELGMRARAGRAESSMDDGAGGGLRSRRGRALGLQPLASWIDGHAREQADLARVRGLDGSSSLDAEVVPRLLEIGRNQRAAGYLVGGYRFTDLSLDYDAAEDVIDVNLSFRGPWIGLSITM